MQEEEEEYEDGPCSCPLKGQMLFSLLAIPLMPPMNLCFSMCSQLFPTDAPLDDYQSCTGQKVGAGFASVLGLC